MHYGDKDDFEQIISSRIVLELSIEICYQSRFLNVERSRKAKTH